MTKYNVILPPRSTLCASPGGLGPAEGIISQIKGPFSAEFWSETAQAVAQLAGAEGGVRVAKGPETERPTLVRTLVVSVPDNCPEDRRQAAIHTLTRQQRCEVRLCHA